jgi:hypothetical protein
MRTAIVLFALALVAPPVTFSASYERQNEAVKQCMEADVDDHASVYLGCMEKAGFKFCSDCPQYGSTMLGGKCGLMKDGPDHPACWYRAGEKPETYSVAMARWIYWIKQQGLQRQQAPYGPDVDPPHEARVAPPIVPRDEWDPAQFAQSPKSEQRGYGDWSKEPLKLSCEGSDWPDYCERHIND